MKKNTQVLNNPLIYIEQPTFTPSLDSKQIVVVKALPKKVEVQEVEENHIEEQDETSLQTKQSEEQEVQDKTENLIENGMHKKGFLNRTIEDKLDILTKLPESMPRPLCEVTTKENTYTCMVLSHSENNVTIELPDNSETIELKKDAILSITIIRL